jgi:two-component system alkaline phosphatase synthesis response regulator PhoP
MARILVVEDEPDIALLLRDDLAAEGHEVEVLTDGDAALERGKEPGLDLIVLDVMLPRRDGFDVCRDLRRARVRTPIIILTAKTHEAEKILGLELGADDYVTKPFSSRELHARIKAVLRRVEGATEEVRRVGNVEIDFARGEVRRDGKPEDITPLELRLLATFIRHGGRVLSRDRLIEEAWGVGTYITDRAVDAHIVNLRRKVEPDPAKPRYLVSVRGLGYRFDG